MKPSSIATSSIVMLLLSCAGQPEPKAPSCLESVPAIASGPDRMAFVLDDIVPVMDPKRVGHHSVGEGLYLWKAFHRAYTRREVFFLAGEVYRMQSDLGHRSVMVTTVQRLSGGQTTLFFQHYPKYTASNGKFVVTTLARQMTVVEWERLESLLRKSTFRGLPYFSGEVPGPESEPGHFTFQAKSGDDYHFLVRYYPSGPLADVFRFLDCLSRCHCVH